MTVARNSQTVLEALRFPTAPNGRTSQVALETLRAALATGNMSQVALEILRANGDEVPIAGDTRALIACVT